MTNTTATPDVAGALVWFEHVITDGLQRIRAHLELSGDELHVHANSEARFERVLATIRALDPSVPVLRETREPAGDVRAVQRLTARSSATPAAFDLTRSGWLRPGASTADVSRMKPGPLKPMSLLEPRTGRGRRPEASPARSSRPINRYSIGPRGGYRWGARPTVD
jgi:hypothetical protein